MFNVFNFRYSLSNNPECPAYDRAYSEAGRVFQDLLCWIIDQEVFTHWEIQSSSYGYQFQSLNICNYCPENNFVFKSSFLFSLLPSFCPSVLGQRRYNGVFVSCGWESAWHWAVPSPSASSWLGSTPGWVGTAIHPGSVPRPMDCSFLTGQIYGFNSGRGKLFQWACSGTEQPGIETSFSGMLSLMLLCKHETELILRLGMPWSASAVFRERNKGS